jgi:hypothetical protein
MIRDVIILKGSGFYISSQLGEELLSSNKDIQFFVEMTLKILLPDGIRETKNFTEYVGFVITQLEKEGRLTA